jgi:hypothetical protein
MKPWDKRTREEAYLFNPPFCCTIIASTCVGYHDASNEAFPFALAFMVLPIIMHKKTREALPRTIRTSIPAWLQEHAEVKIGFFERLMTLKPYTREAIRFGLSFNWIELSNTANIRCIIPNTQINRAIRSLYGDAQDCISRAHFLGKWYGTSASTETTMALWGIRP